MATLKGSKILFGSDFHLNLRSNKEWERSRFLSLFTHMANSDATDIILGGDTFDLPKPNLEELKTFYDGINILNNAGKNVILIEGNHEALSDTKTLFDFIPNVGFTYIPDGVINYNNYDLYFVSHIYCKTINKYKKDISSNKTSILFSHFRSNYGTFIKGEIDVGELSKLFTTIFVGDIHHVYSPYDNVYYPSSPYGIHYELLRDYGLISIDLGKEYSFKWERLSLPSKVLLRAEPKDILDGLTLSDKHMYKIVVLGEPSSKITNILMKNPQVATFDFTPPIQENSEEFDKLVEDLISPSSVEVYDTIITLLETNKTILTQDNKDYLKGVLRDARNI